MKYTPIKTAIILSFVLSAIFFCFSAIPVLSAETDTSKIFDEIKNIRPAPSIELPGLNFSQEPKVVEEGGTTFLYIPYFGEYMAAIYKYAVIVAGILSVIIIMFGGFTWLTSGGSPEKITEAKKYIVGAISGLIIAAGSYALLYTINPNLVQFKSLKVTYQQKIDLADIVGLGYDAGSSVEGVSPNCIAETDMQSLKGTMSIIGGAASYPYLQKDAAEALKKANEIAKNKGREISLISAARTLEKQTALWEEALKKYGSEEKAKKYVAKPSCSAPHLTGRAADLCLKDSPTCSKISSKFANASDPDITLLQEIMKIAGWKRYCNEWWHFEYVLAGSNRCSP